MFKLWPLTWQAQHNLLSAENTLIPRYESLKIYLNYKTGFCENVHFILMEADSHMLLYISETLILSAGEKLAIVKSLYFGSKRSNILWRKNKYFVTPEKQSKSKTLFLFLLKCLLAGL